VIDVLTIDESFEQELELLSCLAMKNHFFIANPDVSAGHDPQSMSISLSCV